MASILQSLAMLLIFIGLFVHSEGTYFMLSKILYYIFFIIQKVCSSAICAALGWLDKKLAVTALHLAHFCTIVTVFMYI